MSIRRLTTCVAQGCLATLMAACSSAQNMTDATFTHPEDSVAVPASRAIALVGASVVSMRNDAVVDGQTIVVRDRRIVALGAEGSVAVPADAFVVDARGSFVMPGLVDMHVHSAIRDAALYVPHGITTVRNLWGFPGLTTYARRVLDEDLRAPTIVTVSPGLDAHPATWPYPRFIDHELDARDTVSTVLAEGWPALKIYDRLTRPAYDSILAIARGRGVRVLGHVPFMVPIQHALASGQHEIEHLTGYEQAVGTRGEIAAHNWAAVDDRRFPALVSATVAAGTWNCPTLAIISEIFRQRWPAERDLAVRNRRRFVKALHDAGARLLVGTDSGIDIVPAGSAIHTELEEFVAAGLTPYQVLRLATYSAAENLQALNDIGTVDVGRRADLLVLDANPLADITNVRRLRGVVLRGTWLPKRVLD